MSKSRLDLSSFRGDGAGGVDVPPPPPPPPRRREQPAPEAPPPGAAGGQEERGSTGRRTKQKAKPKAVQPRSRVTTNVPAALARTAKERADQEELYLSDLVLGAYARHHQAVRDRYSPRSAPGAGLPLRPRRRRRRVADPTQFVLYLSQEELEVFDDLANECGISRSELVSTLLELESDAGSTGERRS